MMDLGRRELLKLGGGAAAASVGYAGYVETKGGSWLYDPATLTAAHNKYFASIDYETLYELQDEYAPESTSEVETPSGSSFDPSELEQLVAVGSASLSGENGVPTGLVSMAASGSFEADPVEDAASESSAVEDVDEGYEGYNLWEAPLPEEEFSGAMSPALESDESFAPENVAFGTRDGALLTSTIVAPKADVESMDGVKTMISAKDGGLRGPDLLTDDETYDSIRSQFDSTPTFLFGATLDPAAVTLAVVASQFVLGFAGGAGDASSAVLEEWVGDLRAGAVGADIDPDAETATLRLFFTYTSPDAARQTGIVQLLDAVSAASGARDVANFDARYEGRTIVVEADGDFEELFEQAEQSPTEATSALLRSQGLAD